jgi:hypothetical protein
LLEHKLYPGQVCTAFLYPIKQHRRLCAIKLHEPADVDISEIGRFAGLSLELPHD